MPKGIPAQKLFKTAFYTSITLIGTLAIAPHLGIFRSSASSTFFTGVISAAIFLVLLWLINISLLYLSGVVDNRKFLVVKRYILSYLLCFLSVWMAKQFIDSFVPDPKHAPAHLYAIFLVGFILNSIVLIIQELILTMDKKSKVELENAELKIKNVEAVNQQLKQQIHPHFLFNSLNTLKTLIKNDPVEAEHYLIKLSDLLRAGLTATSSNTSRLSEEIKLCLNYLDMQKMRFGQSLQYAIKIPETVLQSAWIPVFSILPLLENAIKHNKFTAELPIYIHIIYEEDWLLISNNLYPRTHHEESTGLGLENLSERYHILSGEKVIIENDGKTFTVKIKILTDENSDNRG